MLALLLGAAAPAAAAGWVLMQPWQPGIGADFLRDTLQDTSLVWGEPPDPSVLERDWVYVAFLDLNDDGRNEVIAAVIRDAGFIYEALVEYEPLFALILREHHGGARQLGSIGNLPVFLADTRHNGYRVLYSMEEAYVWDGTAYVRDDGRLVERFRALGDDPMVADAQGGIDDMAVVALALVRSAPPAERHGPLVYLMRYVGSRRHAAVLTDARVWPRLERLLADDLPRLIRLLYGRDRIWYARDTGLIVVTGTQRGNLSFRMDATAIVLIDPDATVLYAAVHEDGRIASGSGTWTIYSDGEIADGDAVPEPLLAWMHPFWAYWKYPPASQLRPHHGTRLIERHKEETRTYRWREGAWQQSDE
ncbi:MAG: hypothetical protein FJX56_01185 [Alphaproteobacteria bacterium]|nr:hypothetical protein [Alphaproteobacteria bacterium]